MRLRSLRQVVLIPVLITFGIGFTMFAVYADRTERQARLQDLEQELQRAEVGSGLAERSRGRPPGPAQPDVDTANPEGVGTPADLGAPVTMLLSVDAVVLAESGAANPFTSNELQHLVASEGFASQNGYRVLTTVRPDDQVLLTALSLEATAAAASEFRRALLAGGALIFALVGGALWLLTARLVRPVRDIADSVGEIAGGDLEVSIHAGGSHEMVSLASDLDQMVAALKQAIVEGQRSAAEATAARAEMQRFLADLAHELRTPLTALKGYSDLYASGMLEPEGGLDRAMERVGSESDRLHQMAANMLQIARGHAVESQVELLDICELAHQVVDDLRAAFVELSVELVMTPATGQFVLGSAGPLHQALLNIGANACEHSTAGDTVTVDVAAGAGTSVVRVIDHGPGVAQQDRERIFAPFYRADVSRSRSATSGAGLGLALVRSIVEGHRGSVAVDDTPGGGATITVVLPTHLDDVM